MNLQATPMSQDFIALSRMVEGYPTNIEELTWTAKAAALGYDFIRFLSLFPQHATFNSPDDFTDRAADLIMLMQQEGDQPKEYLRSPQD